MLTLPIKKKWFDMILSGVKTEEYKELKPYYEKRFLNLFGEIAFYPRPHFVKDSYVEDYEKIEREICFRNGYSKNSPYFVAKCDLEIGKGNPEWGAEPNKEYYVLKILEIKEVEL